MLSVVNGRDGASGFGSRPPACFQEDERAADEAIGSGMYITWVPSVYATLPASASDEIKPGGTGQCCRVHSRSACLCGHSLSDHKHVPVSSKPPMGAFIKPPGCNKCGRCSGFRYAPQHPAECGQFWLEGRRDFDIEEWRRVSRRVALPYIEPSGNILNH
jgi:hypothetical protein